MTIGNHKQGHIVRQAEVAVTWRPLGDAVSAVLKGVRVASGVMPEKSQQSPPR